MTSFKTDIQPVFAQFTGQMEWRFDLTNYDAMKANASAVYSRISSKDSPMPPPPYPPLTQQQIDLFEQWINDGFPP